MPQSNPSFMRRLSLACSSFVSILSRPDFAARVERLSAGGEAPAPATPAPVTPAPPVMRAAPHEAALQLLGLLQREARFVDFVQEDVAAYSDADIGAAARVVHEGCRKVLREHFSIEPVSSDSEGSRITLHEGFNAAAIRLTGNVVGQPPFTGSLGHRGWRVTDSRLPKLAEGHDATILAQAEVEL
jgi:predicted enzyme related to lactoylglutathione lyase